MANTKVTTGVIKDDAVGADQLASNSVVTASIVDNAVLTAKIQDQNVTTAKIANASVTVSKMGPNSVDSDQYVDGSIDTAHIADSQITSAKLETNISIAGELTVGSHLNMGDGDILKMGASADLQIYHDSSHSFISEVGTGNLYLRGANSVYIQDAVENDNMIHAAKDGAVTLYYSNNAKLATATGGVTVTGDLSASTASFTRLEINATNTKLKGDLFANTDAAFDIGASGANRPRNLYLSNSISAADITTTGVGAFGTMSSPLSYVGSGSFPVTPNTSGDDLVVFGSGSHGISILSGTSGDGNIFFGDSGGNVRGKVQYSHNGDIMTMYSVGAYNLLSGANLKLDVAGGITLDADGGQVDFKDGGTLKALIDFTGNNVEIQSRVEDGDLLFRGQDGNSFITALTLDMSNAGLATFNNGIKAGADVAAFGANTGSSANRMAMSMEGSGVSRLICNGADINTNGTFEVFTANSSGTGSSKLTIDASGNVGIGCTASSELTVQGALSIRNATQNFNGGLAAEVNTGIMNFGINEGSGNRFGGSYTQANQGGMLNFDTRSGEPLFQIYGRAAGTANASGTALLNILSDGKVGIGNTDPQVSLALGNSSGERLHVYHGGNVRAGFGVDMSGGSRELSMFHSTTGTNGLISFGKRTESNGSYAETMRLLGSGQLILGGGTTAGDSASSIIVDSGSTTSKYGFRHQGAGKFVRLGCPNSSFAYIETNATSGIRLDAAVSKASGSFRIKHPLPSKNTTHDLVHSFIEGPQADNIYRGVVVLENGTATINIDTVSGMTEGTYVLLNTNTSCFTSNETDWDAVKGSVTGNILTISCQNSSSTATVSLLVIGERHDQHMKETGWTDADGKVIVEPLQDIR